jgi:hypothetical protein
MIRQNTFHPLTSVQTMPNPINGLSDIVRIDCDDSAACAVDAYGELFCWQFQ